MRMRTQNCCQDYFDAGLERNNNESLMENFISDYCNFGN